ncbi:Fic family protein [Achromobacter sp. F4_2707]|uniref:Fic/DOC family protein n=1 Tax=Achromobacter sp. F4_2707 TaxID=3114286 RepID=UPI0039C622CD
MGRYDIFGAQGVFQAGSDDRVLANKLGITRLEDINEAEMVLLQKLYIQVLQERMPHGRIRTQNLGSWHKLWLGNLYDWAGQYRAVNMSKDGFPFAPAAQLPRLMQVFDSDYLGRYTPCSGMRCPQLVEAIAIIHVEFILMHPFREGNGRVSRLLADVMAAQAGHDLLDYSSWEQNKAAYVAAIQKGMECDYELMKYWVRRALDCP